MGGYGSGRPKRDRNFKLDKGTKPWDRQKIDTDKSYEAFHVYRKLGLARNLAKVAASLGKSAALIEGWAAKHSWRERVQAWDQGRQDAEDLAELKEIQKMRKRHVNMAENLQALALLELKKLITTAQRPNSRSAISAEQASRIIDAAAKLERTTRGEPAEIIENRVGLDKEDRQTRIAHLLKARK